ncbi:hypothetical protein FWH09_01960 [Candidatus Saccharibacteria bacterium]|nr:hypothetical protein [Candidatus Saccharibacteria bacterium]
MSRLVSSRKRSKKPFVIILAILLAALAAGLVAWFVTRDRDDNDHFENGINFGPPSEEERQIGDEISQSSKTNPNQGYEPPSPSDDISALIPFAHFVGDDLLITTAISELISGECTLNIWQNGSLVHTEKADIATLPASSECTGFRVSGLSRGDYNVSITIQSSDGRTKTIEADV